MLHRADMFQKPATISKMINASTSLCYCFRPVYDARNLVNFYIKNTKGTIKQQSAFRQFSRFPYSRAPERKIMQGQGDDKGMNINYEELLEAKKKQDVLIIDIRENSEIEETGRLPGSIHIPMATIPNIFKTLSNEQFQHNYGKAKPEKDTKIIVSCRLGQRAAKVQKELWQLGYENVWNYVGGWAEWASKNPQCDK